MIRERTIEPGSPPLFAAVRHLARRRIEGVIVLDLRRGRIYGMNPSAGAVLEALQQPQTAPQIAARFMPPASGAPALPGELDRFLDELAALGLIERCSLSSEAAASAGTAATASARAVAAPWAPPVLLWREEVARVTNQISPPMQIGNPACLP